MSTRKKTWRALGFQYRVRKGDGLGEHTSVLSEGLGRDDAGTIVRVLKRRMGVDWIAVSSEPLPVDAVIEWVVRPACGALTVFCGTVRDHSEGRPGVASLEYEAYLEQVEPRLTEIAKSARGRWPMTGHLALLHRVGRLTVGEVSVVVAASTPHRAEAFEVARYCIDAAKTTVPIWKRESWEGGSEWVLDEHPLIDVEDN